MDLYVCSVCNIERMYVITYEYMSRFHAKKEMICIWLVGYVSFIYAFSIHIEMITSFISQKDHRHNHRNRELNSI